MKTKDSFAMCTVTPGDGEYNLYNEFKRVITKALNTSKNLEDASKKLGVSSKSLVKNLSLFEINYQQRLTGRLSRLKGLLNERRVKYTEVNDHTLTFSIKGEKFNVVRATYISKLEVSINGTKDGSNKTLTELMLIINKKLK